MSNSTSLTKYQTNTVKTNETAIEYLVLKLNNQQFSLPVIFISDVFRPQKITPVPLADADIFGCLNLRGRIVTVIDLREKLGLPRTSMDNKPMSIVVDYKGELYSFLVDGVGEVIKIYESSIESNPSNISSKWAAVSNGIYQLDNALIVILDLNKLMSH